MRIVEAVADDEAVGAVEADEIGLDISLTFAALVEQYAKLDSRRAAGK